MVTPDLVQTFHFTDKKIEASRDAVTCPYFDGSERQGSPDPQANAHSAKLDASQHECLQGMTSDPSYGEATEWSLPNTAIWSFTPSREANASLLNILQ